MDDHVIDLSQLAKRLNGHSAFSPSSSAMWIGCSGSLIPNLLAEDSSGIEAAEGTVAHHVGETWLREGKRPDYLIGTTVKENNFDIEITVSMLDFVQEYVDWCFAIPGTHYVETRVDFSDLTPIPNQSGTADHAACSMSTKTLCVTDLKFGKGVIVYAENNTQAILYAYGFFKKYDWAYDFQTIIIRICQPRLGHFDEITITRAELLDWAKYIKTRAFDAWKLNAPRTPSFKACQWCKIAADCKAHIVFTERLTDGVFDDLEAPITVDDMADLDKRLATDTFSLMPIQLEDLSLAQKAKLYPYRKMIESWWKKLGEDLEAEALQGRNIPGYKVVSGKSNREYINDTKAAEHLEFLGLDKDIIWTKNVISPAVAEEKLRELSYARKSLPNLLNSVVRKPQGKPTMVSIADKRPAIANSFDDVFGSPEDEDEL